MADAPESDVLEGEATDDSCCDESALPDIAVDETADDDVDPLAEAGSTDSVTEDCPVVGADTHELAVDRDTGAEADSLDDRSGREGLVGENTVMLGFGVAIAVVVGSAC